MNTETPQPDIEAYENRIRELEKELARYDAYVKLWSQVWHEMVTCLSPIIGFSHLLLETTSLTEEQTEYVNSLLNSGGYPLLHRVNAFRDFSKMVTGALVLENDSVNIRELIEDAIQDLSSNATKKEITLSFSVQPQISEFVQSDRVRVKQILCRLVEDSIKYSLTGKVEVFLGLMQIEAIDFLHFAVFATEREISPERIERLGQFFNKPIYQIEMTTYIPFDELHAKLLCDLLKGKIWVESQGEKGIAFHFTIPYEPTVAG